MVVFNAGTPNEGVYTLETNAGDAKGELLAFEKADEAARFARQLAGEEFTTVGNDGSVSLDAQSIMWDAQRILQFCGGGGFEVAFVPEGGRITPPASNMYDPGRFGGPGPGGPLSGPGGEPLSGPHDQFGASGPSPPPDDRLGGRGPFSPPDERFGANGPFSPHDSRYGASGPFSPHDSRFGASGPFGPQDGFQNPFGQSRHDEASQGADQRRRVPDPKMTRTQSRGKQVWEAAMKKSQNSMRKQQGSSGADSGADKRGLDQFRANLEKRFGFGADGPWPLGPGSQGPGPEGSGPEGPGPEGPGPEGSGPEGQSKGSE